MRLPLRRSSARSRVGIGADNFGAHHAAVVQHAFDAPRAADDVIVGQRIAVGRNDHAGARAIIEIARRGWCGARR